MKALVVGTGAREHAIVKGLAADPQVDSIVAAPGNPGMAADAQVRDVDILDGDAVAELAQEIRADLVVIGPEAPLVAGVADAVRAAGIDTFGRPPKPLDSRGRKRSRRTSWPPPTSRPPARTRART